MNVKEMMPESFELIAQTSSHVFAKNENRSPEPWVIWSIGLRDLYNGVYFRSKEEAEKYWKKAAEI